MLFPRDQYSFRICRPLRKTQRRHVFAALSTDVRAMIISWQDFRASMQWCDDVCDRARVLVNWMRMTNASRENTSSSVYLFDRAALLCVMIFSVLVSIQTARFAYSRSMCQWHLRRDDSRSQILIITTPFRNWLVMDYEITIISRLIFKFEVQIKKHHFSDIISKDQKEGSLHWVERRQRQTQWPLRFSHQNEERICSEHFTYHMQYFTIFFCFLWRSIKQIFEERYDRWFVIQ